MIFKGISERSKKVAELLFNSFATVGILGHKIMPEDEPPEGVDRGSLEHLLFITLTVSIDYQRDALALWTSSRQTFVDPQTRYLFNLQQLGNANFDKIVTDMQKHGLSKKQKRDADIWRTVGITFLQKWGGNPLNFLESCQWDSQQILKHLIIDCQFINGKYESDFPNLRGPKIGPLWVRMLRDNVGITKLKNLDRVPIPVDIHIARASLTTGIVRGQYNGRLEEMFKDIREAWFEGVMGISVKGRQMIALDVDEPLWHLSKYGCSKNRDKNNGNCLVEDKCELKDFCVKGRISIENNLVEMIT